MFTLNELVTRYKKQRMQDALNMAYRFGATPKFINPQGAHSGRAVATAPKTAKTDKARQFLPKGGGNVTGAHA